MANRIPVGVLGATGAVGQKFVSLLEDHPWFELTELAASDRSAGKSYKDATVWRQYKPIPERIRDLKVKPCEPTLDCRVVFSSLDSSVAGEVEQSFARNDVTGMLCQDGEDLHYSRLEFDRTSGTA